MSLAPLLGLPGKVKTLLDRLTATRAGYLDNLDAAVTTRAPSSTALSSATWTSARAGYLDKINTFLDADTGIMVPKFQLITTGTGATWTRPAGIVGDLVWLSGGAAGEAYNSTGPIYGQGGETIQQYPYSVGATVTYTVGAAGTGTGGANGGNTVWGTITLLGGGVTSSTGCPRGNGTTIVATNPPGPFGANLFTSSLPTTLGGGGLKFNNTLYCNGGNSVSNDGGGGVIFLEWWEYA